MNSPVRSLNDIAYSLGVEDPSSPDAALHLADGSDLTGKPLNAYIKAFAQTQDAGSARDAALGAAIAENIATERQRIAEDPQRLDPTGEYTHQLNVATDALLSKDSYYQGGIGELLPAGITRLSSDSDLAKLGITSDMLQPDDNSGFMAAAYYDQNRKIYVIADKGTVNLADWETDAGQALGFSTQQYADAANIAIAINGSQAAGNVEYTGHSLGGGLASLQAGISNAPAITFNAAGLNSNTAAKYRVDINGSNNIEAYYVSGEPLSWAQDHTPLPSALGTRIPLTADNPVSINSDGLSPNSPMTGMQVFSNSTNANLHFMGAVESSIYTNFSVFQSKPGFTNNRSGGNSRFDEY